MQCPLTGQIEQRKVAKVDAWLIQVDVSLAEKSKIHPWKKTSWEWETNSVSFLAIVDDLFVTIQLERLVFFFLSLFFFEACFEKFMLFQGELSSVYQCSVLVDNESSMGPVNIIIDLF